MIPTQLSRAPRQKHCHPRGASLTSPAMFQIGWNLKCKDAKTRAVCKRTLEELYQAERGARNSTYNIIGTVRYRALV